MRLSGIRRVGRGTGFAGAQGWRGVVALTVMATSLVLPASAATARDADSPLRIPLEPMGYQALMPEFLLAGSSMLTVDFVDNDRLLVTFGLRRLMKRAADTLPNDDDRTIGAFLVELPSGKVLARTEWRVHDRSQYLWNLGHGRFLLRLRDQLTLIAPLASDANDAFRESPFLHFDRHIVAILLSPDDDLLTVESTKWAMGSDADNVGFSADSSPVQINFFRLTPKGAGATDLIVTAAGTVRAHTALALPMTSAGFLDVLDGGRDRKFFNFDEYSGKVNELGQFDTTCFPRSVFVDRSEFVAFGCRGSADKQDLAAFNFKGEEMWQQNLYDSYVSPIFAFAPAAGRFALGRTIVSGSFDTDSPLTASVVNAQEVRVYQSYSGKQIFRTECTPVERAGQNFALSPDGLRLAAVRVTQVHHAATKDDGAYTQNETAVEVYTLPPLTDADQAAVKQAAALAPADSGARIDLALERTVAPAATDSAAAETAAGADGAATGAATAEAGAANPQAATTTVNEGDAAPTEHRPPPTLYGPDEKPQKPQ